MYTLRLILQGVIFFTMVPSQQGDQLWLLFLDPGYKTALHHQARLYVDSSFIDATSRPSDGTDACGNYFELAGEHLTLGFAQATSPKSIFFASSTAKAGASKPCSGCGSPYTFRQQKDDIHWVNDLDQILRFVPLTTGTFDEATKLREDILADSYSTDGLILARLVIPAGEVRTYTLWHETRPDNLDEKKITTYTFEEPAAQECDAKKPSSAVAETVVIEVAAPVNATFASRPLADKAKPGKKSIVLKPGTETLVSAKLSSIRLPCGAHNPAERGDFKAFYELLKHPDYFTYLPLPAPCKSGDVGGACSPAKP